MAASQEEQRRTQEDDEEEEEQPDRGDPPQQQCLCDFCGESRALIYCRADSAKLCFSCDREVHSANPLFNKHTRSLLCDACDSNPASFRCSIENLVLCQNCDWDTHGQSLASLHNRRPLEGFSGCPSAIELASILGFEDLGDKSLLSTEGVGDGCLVGSELRSSFGVVDGFSDISVWDTPTILTLDDLIASTDSSHNFQAIGFPPLPKNRNAACGKHKEETLHQLRELLKLEPDLGNDLVPERIRQSGYTGSGFEHDPDPIVLPDYKASLPQWHGNSCEAADGVPLPFGNHFDKSSSVLDRCTDFDGCDSHGNGGHKWQPENQNITVPTLPRVDPHELVGHNRDSAISRYKEKKKVRRYGKHVRYESRKVRAESRTRVRGRFARIVHKNIGVP